MILTISGSSSYDSSNSRLLKATAIHFDQYSWATGPNLAILPLFSADKDTAPYPTQIVEWKKMVATASSVIISTPAYLYNIPAVLKNALEWLTTSGELDGKPVLAITYTPFPPRGKEAMQSLLWSLKALNARVVAQCPLYQNELTVGQTNNLVGEESLGLLEDAIGLL